MLLWKGGRGVLANWVGGEEGGRGLGYVPCFRDFDGYSICMGEGCGRVGAVRGEE